MAQKKLLRFEAIRSFPNVLQYPEGMAGKWNDFFKNDHPLTLELACGKGEYSIGLAKMFPDRNCIGVDLKGNRLYIGARKCLEEKIINVAFLRTQIDKLNLYFASGEVREIWLTFPDPQLRKSRAKKRLTHPRFLRLYQQILVPGGLIHLKTDSPALYAFTLLVIEMYGLILHEHADDIYAKEPVRKELQIKTHYEGLDIAQSKRVHYICFSLPGAVLPEIDHFLYERIKEDGQTPTEGLDFYYNELGYIVLTEKYHLDKGFCCGLGCQHCPYDYENVPEPRRFELLEKRNSHGSNKE